MEIPKFLAKVIGSGLSPATPGSQHPTATLGQPGTRALSGPSASVACLRRSASEVPPESARALLRGNSVPSSGAARSRGTMPLICVERSSTAHGLNVGSRLGHDDVTALIGVGHIARSRHGGVS